MSGKFFEQIENEIENGIISPSLPMKGLVELVSNVQGEERQRMIRDEWMHDVEEKESFGDDLTALDEITPTKPPDNVKNILEFFDEDPHLGFIHNSFKGEDQKTSRDEKVMVPPPPILPPPPSTRTSSVKTENTSTMKEKSNKKLKPRRKKFKPPRKRKLSPRDQNSKKNDDDNNIPPSRRYFHDTNDNHKVAPPPPPPPPSFPKRVNPGFVTARDAGGLYGKPNTRNEDEDEDDNKKGQYDRSNSRRNNYGRRRGGGNNNYGRFDPVNSLVQNNAFGNVTSQDGDDDDEYDDNQSDSPPPISGRKRRRTFKVPRKRNEKDKSGSSEPAKKKRKLKGKGKGKDGGLSDALIELLGSEDVPEELSHLEVAMLERVATEVIQRDLEVKFDDISGLEDCKKAVYEVVIFPLNCKSNIFQGLRSPGHVLLYGPPGTGKTLIGKAVAGEAKAIFFSISASSLMSKWVGEGERLVRTMFELAQYLAPSVIFIDEIDSLLSKRGSEDSSSGLRRMKTEFLVQLDGANTNHKKKKKSDDSNQEGGSTSNHVVVIGATNLPQEIDDAFVRRMSKRLYVPLPSPGARKQIFHNLIRTGLVDYEITDEELDQAVELTDGYSGADLSLIMKKAAYLPVQDVVDRMGIKDFQETENPKIRPVVIDDILNAVGTINPSVDPKTLDQYVEWNKKFGAQ